MQCQTTRFFCFTLQPYGNTVKPLFMTASFHSALEQVQLKEISTREYRLMYFFGAWVSKCTIIAENDKEAVFDADQIFKDSHLQGWEHGVALFCGNRMVKEYKPNR